MLTIGLTGGVASGKSLAAKFLAEQGAVVLDADRAGHELLREPAICQALTARWGPKILDRTGAIDRAAVAELVFGEAPEVIEERRFLEGLLHPLIRDRLEAEKARNAALGEGVFVLDAALLLESGWDAACDRVIFVDAPRETRLARAAVRGWTAVQFAQREAAQWPVDRKRAGSDWLLTNVGSPPELREQVTTLWRQHVMPLISQKSPEVL